MTDTLTLDVPVNVKVKGENAMRKGVTLVADPNDSNIVRVRTGKAGRPAKLAKDDIQKVTVLKATPAPKAETPSDENA